MKTSCPSAVALPSVEECLQEASALREELLRMCVRRQCRDITVTCSERSRAQCQEWSQGTRSTMLGFTLMTFHGTHHRFYPVEEIHWCEEPASRECILKAVIHELAHSCGWDHKQGWNVPGDDPPHKSIRECECVGKDGERTSCG
jgi:hypothetical protein